MGRKGETTSYTQPSFEECYSKKLNELKVQLKSTLYGDNPFVVSQEYACKKCSGRIHIHTQAGKWLCLLCALRPGVVAPRWSKTTRAKVEAIMQGYPDPEQCYREWAARQPKPYVPPPQEAQAPKEVRRRDPQLVEFGKRIREARISLHLTQEDLAAKIYKKKRNESLSSSSINIYESGSICPPEHIMSQLIQILGSGILEDSKEEVKV